ITIQLRDTPVREALRLMEKHGSHALYVMDGKRVAGVVTYRDLAACEMDTTTPSPTIRGTMITDYPTAACDTQLHELYGAAGQGLPIAVTDDADQLVAVIEPGDVLAHLSGDALANDAALNGAGVNGKEAAHVQPG